MVKVLAHGEDSYRLVNTAGSDVGWIRPRTIGFGGFATEEAAFAAALAGGRALANRFKREFGVSHPALSERPRLRKKLDGAYEWIADGRVPIARLIREETETSQVERFAIEFVLPSYASDAVAINSAQVVYGAIDRAIPEAATRTMADAQPVG